MKLIFIIGVFVILIFGGMYFGLAGAEGRVEVVVKTLPSGGIEGKSVGILDVEKKEVPVYEVKKVTQKELKEIRENPGVVGVYSKHYVRAFLDESVTVINSTNANNLERSSLNLSGTAQTVCVVDTGVNFSHSDLVGKNVSCVVDCFNKACIEDCSVGDDNGHGTHVAGIVAASGGITGIAPNVSLIGVKILGSDGGGSGNDDDIDNAIDYCVVQGVSVITMSLGTVALYGSACDDSVPAAWVNAINAAFAANISVVVASGNDGNVTHISAPACVGNATAVGDSYDGNVGFSAWGSPVVCTDTTTAVDQIVCHANRNALVKLFAPGAMINSTASGGGYEERGGTSMATPMVAGAIALINQYMSLSGQTRTPAEVEDVLNDSGLVLYDEGGSGENFSRIDVYAGLLSIDVDAPNVTLVSPADDKINISVNQSFVCNVTDWQLANLTLSVWNSTGLYYNESVNVSGTSNETTFNLTDMALGSYSWNCLGVDALGNFNYSLANFSLTIGGTLSSLVSPVNATHTSAGENNFTCNSSSEASLALANVTFSLWNSTGLVYNVSEDVSGVSNSSVFNYSFSVETNYSWNCLVVNNGSNSSWGENNFSFVYDTTFPSLNLTALPISVTSNSVSKSFGFNVTDDNLANCSLIVGGSIVLTNSSINTSIENSFSRTFTPGTYTWNINCSDFAGNVNASAGNSFVITAVSSSSSSSSGGGSSGGGTLIVASAAVVADEPEVYDVGVDGVSGGYTQSLKKDDRVNFSIFDGDGGRHLLTVEDVGVDYVELLIESEPVSLKLGVGQSAKLNLSSVERYDLFVELIGIVDGSAKLKIQLIDEAIEVDTIVETKIVEKLTVFIKDYFWVVLVLIVLLVGVVFVVIMVNRKKLKGVEVKNKDGKGKKVKA